MSYTPSRERIAPVLVKAESIEGTEATSMSGSSDALLTVDSPNVASPSFDLIPYRPHSATLTRPKDLIGPQMTNVSLSFWMAGSGQAASRAVAGFDAIAALWTAAGARLTASSGTTLTFSPATIAQLGTISNSSPWAGPATIQAEMNGVLHKTTGVRGNMRMTGSPRSGVVCTFTGMGFYFLPTIGTISGFVPPSLTYPIMRGANVATITEGSKVFAPVLQSFTFDTGSDTQRIESINAETGIARHITIDRNPTLELTIAMTTAAEANGAAGTGVIGYPGFFSNWSGTTTHAVSITFGTGTGRVCTLSVPFGQITNITHGVTNGVRTMTIAYKCTNATADAEWSLAIV